MRRPLRLLAVVAAASLLFTACEYREVDGVGTRTYDAELPPPDDLTSFGGCSRNSLGQWQAVGTVVNQTSDMATYAVTVAFLADAVRLDERTAWIRDLRPGERAELNRAWWISGADDVTGCEVLTVDRLTTPIVAD